MNTLIGTAGALIILVFFFLDERHYLTADSFWYDLGNFIGSSLLVVYAFLIGSWPFLILNTVWGVISLKDLICPTRRGRRS